MRGAKIWAMGVMAVMILSGMMGLAAAKGKNSDCTTIQDGVLKYDEGRYLEGQLLKVGYDIFGYNYQAHLFNGYYCNVYLNGDGYPPYEGNDTAYYQRLVDDDYANTIDEAEQLMNAKWYWPYRDIWVNMKWNDAWLSNKDCDGDGKLDRHYGYTNYIGSGAWLTNHMWGINEDGTHWEYFTKIVAVPEDAELENGIWYTADGTEIGPVIWGSFATIQEVSNDPSLDEHGILYLNPAPTGFGYYIP